MTKRDAIFPADRHALYDLHQYSAAIRSGDLLFISGQVGSREDGSPEPVFEDLELDHRFLRDEALKIALLPRIQEAKRALSETLIRNAGAEGEYRWAEQDDGSSFAVELNEILRAASPGQPCSWRHYTTSRRWRARTSARVTSCWSRKGATSSRRW